MTNLQGTEKARLVGVVTHYFGHIGVMAAKLSGTLRVGDTVKLVGATTDFEDVVQSIQVEHESVEKAGAGDEVGVKVKGKVREGDRVYVV